MSNTENSTAAPPENENSPKKKNKFWRRLLRVTAWVIAVIIVLLALLLAFRDVIIKNMITGVGSWLTGTTISLDEFETSLTRGEVKITNLQISNPRGYEKENMMSLGAFYLNIDISTLLADEIVIEEIDVNGLSLTGEFKKNGKFNAVELTENIQQKVPTPDDADPETDDDNAIDENSDDSESSDDTPEQTLAIRSISVSNSSAVIYDDRVGIPVSVPLAYSSSDLQLARTGESLVVMLHRLALQLQYACSGVANAGELVIDTGKQLVDTTGNTGKLIIKTTGNTGKAIVNSTTDAGKAIVDSTADAGEAIIDSTADAGKKLTESGKKLLDAFKF